MSRLPKDCTPRQIGSLARQMAHGAFDATIWEFHELTGTDHGTDGQFELIEECEWANKRIEVQIKGTTNLSVLKNGNISFPLDTKTANYGIRCSYPFVLLVADISNKKVYYLPLQEYFMQNTNALLKLDSQEKIAVHIPVTNCIGFDQQDLVNLTKNTYRLKHNNTIAKYSD